MFKVLVLQALYNLADEQTEYQILDRLSFMKFLGLELHDDVPDARTIWLFRETLIAAAAVEKLFARFDAMLAERNWSDLSRAKRSKRKIAEAEDAHGFQARASAGSKRFSPEGKKEKREGRAGGQIIDATFVEAPRQRNGRDANLKIKNAEVPAGWSDKKKAHNDMDARWTKKNNTAFYGYKNHVNIDRKNKLIRKYKVTDASVHDSRELDNVLDPRNDSQATWADSATRSKQQEARLQENGCISNIHERAWRNTPLTPEQEAANTERSIVRVRVEHVFGHIETAMNGCYFAPLARRGRRPKSGLKISPSTYPDSRSSCEPPTPQLRPDEQKWGHAKPAADGLARTYGANAALVLSMPGLSSFLSPAFTKQRRCWKCPLLCLPRLIEEPGETCCSFRLGGICCAHDARRLPRRTTSQGSYGDGARRVFALPRDAPRECLGAFGRGVELSASRRCAAP